MAQNKAKAAEEDQSFEEALRRLELAAEALKKEDTTLEDAIRCYEEGVKYYERCSEILNAAKQKIRIFEEASQTLKDF